MPVNGSVGSWRCECYTLHWVPWSITRFERATRSVGHRSCRQQHREPAAAPETRTSPKLPILYSSICSIVISLQLPERQMRRLHSLRAMRRRRVPMPGHDDWLFLSSFDGMVYRRAHAHRTRRDRSGRRAIACGESFRLHSILDRKSYCTSRIFSILCIKSYSVRDGNGWSERGQ